MPSPRLNITPPIAALGANPQQQLCYALLQISPAPVAAERPINWAFVADASRSMRIPIVDDEQFRALVRESGAQETLVDGVPVWQLSEPVPAAMRATVKSPLDHVAHALHSLLERLDVNDRFALIACAEEALAVIPSAPGDSRVELAHAIGRLPLLSLGEATNLASGLRLAMNELRRGGLGRRVDRVLLLTDGFTQEPERCAELAAEAAGLGIAISTIGIGGEFQEHLLTEIADISGGLALLATRPDELPRLIAQEFATARAAGGLRLALAPANGVVLRRVTRTRPSLAVLHEATAPDTRLELLPGSAGEGIDLLIELLVPASQESRAPVLEATLSTERQPPETVALVARRYANPPAVPAAVQAAAARANIARMHRRAHQIATRQPAQAAHLLEQAAMQLQALGLGELATAYHAQAGALASGIDTSASAKTITYETRRLGEAEAR